MKHAFLLLLYSSALIAQTPVATGGTASGLPWWAFPLGGLALAVVIYFVLKRKRPDLATKIDAGAGTVAHLVSGEAMALLGRAHDTIATQAATISQQAAVVGSAPVQAVINAPPPAQAGPGAAQSGRWLPPSQSVPPAPLAAVPAVPQTQGVAMPSDPPPSKFQYPGPDRQWWPGSGHGYFVDNAAVAAQKRFDYLISVAQFAPPPGGWPPYDPDQSSATHKDSDYVHTNATGGADGGYYSFPGLAERNYKPMTPATPAGPNPYDGNGLTAAIMAVTLGSNNVLYAKADAALQAALGPAGPNTAYAQCVNTNGEADPTWNGALYGIVTGASVDDAWASVQKGVNGLYNDPAFTRAQLEAAVPVINGYR